VKTQITDFDISADIFVFVSIPPIEKSACFSMKQTWVKNINLRKQDWLQFSSFAGNL